MAGGMFGAAQRATKQVDEKASDGKVDGAANTEGYQSAMREHHEHQAAHHRAKAGHHQGIADHHTAEAEYHDGKAAAC